MSTKGCPHVVCKSFVCKSAEISRAWVDYMSGLGKSRAWVNRAWVNRASGLGKSAQISRAWVDYNYVLTARIGGKY